jgi:hypothetical protein
MKFETSVIFAALMAACSSISFAQGGDQSPPDRPPGGPGGGRRPPPPIIEALDLNHDGTISADEIARAPESLKKLDKNGDGQLTPDELRPPRPPSGPRQNEAPKQNGQGQRG